MIGDILQPTHLIFVLVVALLVLGPKRLPEAGRALGRGLRDFKDALSGDNDDRQVHEELTANAQAAPTANAQAAPTANAQAAPTANAQAAPTANEHSSAPSAPAHDPVAAAPVAPPAADPVAAPGPAPASIGAHGAERSAHD